MRPFLATLLVASIALQPAYAAVDPEPEPQFGIGKKGGDKDKDKTKEDERDRKERERDQKNLNRYEKLKEYSTTKYRNDPDFRDDVDEAWEDLLRNHSDFAYSKNTNMASYIKTVNEDNWRMHVNLYDNLLVQNLVNRIGQKVVPESSEKLYAFKVTPSPIPMAETLATGTVYISTGMISLLDSEAQLAYVLAHEMAHVHYDHWKERTMMEVGAEEYAKDQQTKARRIGMIAGIGAAVAGGALGARNGGGAGGATMGALALGGLGYGVGTLIGNIANRPLVVNWDRVQEDQADELAIKQVLNANFDAREVPKLYIALEKAVTRDTRVGLGFLGDRKRITQRRERIGNLLENALKAELEAKLKNASLTGDSAEFRNLMAELKRDNGIMAYYHDMFDLSRNNLRDALAVRDNDPAAHYFFGKVMSLTGRTPAELKEAGTSFQKAASLDYRNQNYGAFIHAAMSMVGEKRSGNEKEITGALDTYVTNHAKWMIESGQLRMFPPNLDTVYEYMRLYGDKGWRPKAPEVKDMLMYTGYANYLPADAGVIHVNDSSPMKKASGSTDNTLQKAVQTVAPAVGGSPVRNAVGAAAGAAVRKK
jgi:predicted Zn-dependent protease